MATPYANQTLRAVDIFKAAANNTDLSGADMLAFANDILRAFRYSPDQIAQMSNDQKAIVIAQRVGGILDSWALSGALVEARDTAETTTRADHAANRTPILADQFETVPDPGAAPEAP